MVAKSTSARLHGLDMLRGIAMMLGIVLHSTISYKTGYRYDNWVEDPPAKSYIYDWIYLWINSFRMQLFFLLAGFFARLLLNKIGFSPFFKNRFDRILIPFVLSLVLILPLTYIPHLYYTYSAEGVGDPWVAVYDFLLRFFTLKEWGGLWHLWFLYYLLIYYVFVAALLKIARGAWWTSVIDKWNTLLGPRIPLVPFVLTSMLIVGLISIGFSTPLPMNWLGLKPPLVQLSYYAAFFSIGWFMEKHRDVFEYLNRRYTLFVWVGTILSLGTVYWVNAFLADVQSNFWLGSLLKMVFASQSILLVFGLIGLFNSKFGNPSPTWRYLSDGSYWIYLIHLPLVFTFQHWLVDSVVPTYLRFVLVVSFTSAICVITYDLLVRYTFVGRILNGKKYERRKLLEQSG